MKSFVFLFVSISFVGCGSDDRIEAFKLPIPTIAPITVFTAIPKPTPVVIHKIDRDRVSDYKKLYDDMPKSTLLSLLGSPHSYSSKERCFSGECSVYEYLKWEYTDGDSIDVTLKDSVVFSFYSY